MYEEPINLVRFYRIHRLSQHEHLLINAGIPDDPLRSHERYVGAAFTSCSVIFTCPSLMWAAVDRDKIAITII